MVSQCHLGGAVDGEVQRGRWVELRHTDRSSACLGIPRTGKSAKTMTTLHTHVRACVRPRAHTHIYFSTYPKYILHLREPPSHYLPFSTQASQPQKHSTPMGTLQHLTLFPKALIKTHSSYHVIHSPNTLFSKLLHSSIPTHRVT